VEAAQDIKKPFVAIAGDAESALPRVKGFDTPEAARDWAEGTDGAFVYKVTGRDAGGKIKALEPIQTEAGRFQKSKPASAATSAADGAGGFVKGLDDGMEGLPEAKNTGLETIDFSVEGGKARGGRENIYIADLAGKEGAGEAWYKADGSLNMPPNYGAVAGTEKTIELQPGSRLGRYGGYGKSSDFVAAPGSIPDSLSLPPDTNLSLYQEFEVLKPIPGVTKSIVAPWGGSTGGGIQFRLPMTIKDLIKKGYIR
jgi:hypothetical protein